MDKVPAKPKKTKKSSREDLLNLDKEDLVDRILQLEAHNVQLKNIINRNMIDISEKSTDGKRKFDFNKCHYRRVILRILYFGWDYQGLAVQEDSTQTIEHHLFHALTKSCLIENRETSQYHRCGRTDKGVSAFEQTISITLRSKFPKSEQDNVSTEMPYCKILNRLLPKDIRAIAWMPIPDEKADFSARFDCKKRQYKYYFPKSSLNIAAMREACSYLIGSHDFRHLCKMDVGNGVTEFRREILTADIIAIDNEDSPTSMCAFIIEGNAFLWHQIRCIMGVLLLIGECKEKPDVIRELLDIDSHDRKPQYNMALDLPLNLFGCTYNIKYSWVYDLSEMSSVIRSLQSMWTVQSVKSTMIKDCIQQLENAYYDQIQNPIGAKDKSVTETDHTKSDKLDRDSNTNSSAMRTTEKDDMQSDKRESDGHFYIRDVRAKETEYTSSVALERDRVMAYTDCLLQGVKPKVYTPLLKREKCSSLEERIEYFKKKRKIADP